MGKIIEFKKFSKRINIDNLNIDHFSSDTLTDEDSVYIRKEIEIKLNEVDHILNCIYKQILINDKLIVHSEENYDLNKLTYLRDFNDKLHDVMYFLTNSPYHDPIIIKINFLEFKYLFGSLQLEVDILNENKDKTKQNSLSEYINILEGVYNRFSPIYMSWQKEL